MPDDKKAPEVPGKVGVAEKAKGAETNMPGATNPKMEQSETRPPTGEPTKLKPSEQQPTADAPAPSPEQTKQSEEQRKAFQERMRADKKELDEMVENLVSYQASKEHGELEQADKDRVSRQLKALKEAADLSRQRIATFVS
jgi:hypothetical protein